MRSLSKSRYQTGLQCPKALWLSVHRHDLATPTSESQQAIFDTGTGVGRLAQQLFPGGVEVTEDHRHPADALKTTARLLAEGATILYEPAFSHEGTFARVDVLVAAGDGRWDLYEVKSSGSLKDVHITDAALQAYAVEGSGLILRTINIVHLDTGYEYPGGDYDLDALFTVEDVSESARAYLPLIPEQMARFQAMLEGPEPDVRIGRQCGDPYPCDFADYCHAFLSAEHPVTGLPRLGEPLLHALLDAGITCICDIPDEFEGLSAAQREAVAVVKAGRPHVDTDGLASALAQLEWPVYHLDFETIAPALPLWAGTHPYQVIPFQYSVHVHHEDGTIEHREYLHAGTGDPRRPLAVRMLADLGEHGSVTHYTPYERTRLAELVTALPDLAPALTRTMARLYDLEPMIRTNTRHPLSAGRSSIKYVLPAWVPGLSYSGMNIADGQTASVRYMRVVTGRADPLEAEATMRDLLEYCGLDTLAMVRLLDEMRSLAGGEHPRV